ncbi:hypothetical protein BH09ACT1_BH09ACT1_11800 [soil metagenome]
MTPEQTRDDGDGSRRFAARPPRNGAGVGKVDLTTDLVESMVQLASDANLIVGQGHPYFDSDDGRLVRHAADAIVIKFHDLCERLSPAVRERHPTIPWRDIKGMRNRLGHQYRSNDYNLIWNTLATDIPTVVAELRSELSEG